MKSEDAKRQDIKKRKILFIDDNYDYFKVLQLASEGKLEFDYAPDGFTAIHMAKKEKYDLVLCDIYMPYIDGIKLMLEFSKKHFDIPFILISGNIDEKVTREAIQAGVYNMVSKPVQIFELLDKIEKAIALHDSEQVHQVSDQEKAHIYNMLKMYYYDVDKIMLSIGHFQIPLSSVRDEIEKKSRTGKCIFDDLQNLKYFSLSH